MTFSQWLTKQQHRDDAVGELARAAAQDVSWPHPTTEDETVAYITIEVRRAADETIDKLSTGIHKAFEEYRDE